MSHETKTSFRDRLPKIPLRLLGFNQPAKIQGLKHERDNLPQVKLEHIIERFEKGWAGMGYEPREVRRWGSCNIAPDIFMYVASDESQKNEYNVDIKKYQVLTLHEEAGGKHGESFQHAMNTAVVDGEQFLVDLTFAQFRGPDGMLQQSSAQYSSGVENANPLAVELITNGYAPLTDGNLKEYLRITSLSADKSYIDNVSIEWLGNVPDLPREFDTHEGAVPSFGL
jgi:hypothetical protein